MANPETLAAIARLKAGGLSYNQIAKELGMSKDKAQKLGKRNPFRFSAGAEQVATPQPITIHGDCVVTGDMHVPDTDASMISRLHSLSAQLGIKKLAIVGDLFNMDMFSAFPLVSLPATLQHELTAAREAITYLLGTYETIYWCRGNHDQRLIALTRGQFQMNDLAAAILDGSNAGRLETSVANYMWCISGDKRWMLAHQFEYARKRTVKAQELAQLHQCNVVACHEHHAGMTLSQDGRWTVVSNPCLCNDPAYVKLNMTTKPAMIQGFSWIKNGRVDQYVRGALYGPEEV